MDSIRILIADDHPLFRDGMHGLLDSVPDTEVVGEATTGEEVIAQAAALQPDVVLMDIKMPGVNGIEATREIVHTSPHIGVLVVTMYEDDDFVFSAMRAGARGYVLKGANQAEMLRAIRAVANGEVIFGPAIAQRVISFLSTPHADRPGPPVPRADRARDGGAVADRAGPDQRGDRRASGAEPEDGPQPRLQYLQQAPGSRPCPGGDPGEGSRPRSRGSREARVEGPK